MISDPPFNIVVVGSAVMDLVIRAQRLPLAGETVLGSDFANHPGGKGANQAAAIARLGGEVSLVSKMGDDPFGAQLREALQGCGVNVDHLLTDSQTPTAVGMITVRPDGTNTIVVDPGANMRLTPEEAIRALSPQKPKVVICQLEIPMETNKAVVETISDDCLFIVNPAPATEIPDEVLRRVDYLTPNETECLSLTGILPTDDESCITAGQAFLNRGVKNVVITLGDKGAFLVSPTCNQHFPAVSVQAVDTTAAGDAFTGALALALSKGQAIDQAIPFANKVAALSTTRQGAMPSLPSAHEVTC